MQNQNDNHICFIKFNQRKLEKCNFKSVFLCLKLSHDFQKNGYVVQSVRIVTNLFGEYLNTENLKNAREVLRYLSNLLNSSDLSGIRIRFAVGEARTKEEIALVPELIKEF